MKLSAIVVALAATITSPAFAECSVGGLRSITSQLPVAITVSNKTKGRMARLLWIDFDGNRKHYATLAPGVRQTQQTYEGHVWVIEDQNGNCGMIFTAGAPAEIVVK